jgi:hypothetical protein
MSTWTISDVQRTGVSREGFFGESLRRAERAAKDAKLDQRQALKECKLCFYFGHGLAGQAFTQYECRACNEPQMHANTRVPVLCSDCATTLGACVSCGGSREWEPKR